MEKKLEDYLHLYIGQNCYSQGMTKPPNKEPIIMKIKGMDRESEKVFWVDTEYYDGHTQSAMIEDITLLLLHLSEMTREHMVMLGQITSPLETLTDEDWIYVSGELKKDYKKTMRFDGMTPYQTFEVTRLLLKLGYDLFELIESGLAIKKSL
jgi:hypothetical protein